MKEFYDGRIRPHLHPKDFEWTREECNRICYNCGTRFGSHVGYQCPNPLHQDILEKRE